MKVILTRYYQKECTLGLFQIAGNNHDPIYTLENPWVDNKPFVSCIPQGVYQCLPYVSEKYPDVWELQNVVGRSKILIHSGNKESHTSGCILVGTSSGYLNGEKAVLSSKTALNYLRDTIGAREFEIEIINLFMES